MAAEKQITVKGLKQEKMDLQKAYDAARTSSEKAVEVYAKAKDALVKFNNGYGRVLQVLESDSVDVEE